MKKSEIHQYLKELGQHKDRLDKGAVSQLFADDPARFGQMSLNIGSLMFDFSKNRLDQPALACLIALARARNLEDQRDAMFRGDRINVTEDRAVLHTALRNRSGTPLLVDGNNITAEVDATLQQMRAFCDAVRSGAFRPAGKPVTDVVNIGIGGSDLGPRMAANALAPYHDGPCVHFVANVDGADIADTLKHLNPETTLIIVASKTFTTQETMTNAHTARAWLEKGVGKDRARDHFVALSTNLDATVAFGIPAERTFGFWDWVGGRYSVWSSIGIALMIAIGWKNFEAFLDGAHQVDEHFRSSPLEENIPALMGLIGFWHRNVCGYGAHAIIPYDQRMEDFPPWLQQLDMESNGKSVDMQGEPLSHHSGPIIFGEPGTNGQHAFFQLLHQGTDIVPVDFLVAASGHEPELDHHHKILVANCLAQARALMTGRSLDDAGGNPHRKFSGNRPSNTFIYAKLDPHTLGMLLALYEHKVLVQGAIWNINSFDQWGVELGKELAQELEPMIDKKPDASQDSSTIGLLTQINTWRNT